jgi:hypothetical protein
MGIKFHCPNGHKLNVKAFLAGKKGVCPKCGTKVRIPLVSEAGLVDSEVDEGGGEAGSVMIPNGNGAIAAAIAAQASSGSSSIAASGPGAVAAPPMPPAAAQTTGVRDPIAEAPTAIWYVRPPAGGQYGPARADEMRTWLSEGRVSSDSFVWRDGWADWRIAGQLFPDLQSSTGAAAMAPAMISMAAPAVRQQPKRRSNNNLAIAILAGLAGMIFLLLAALGYILFVYR